MSNDSNSDFIATHTHPAWIERADYIFRCRIESQNGGDEWEQMWGKVIEENTYMVCCIPFFVYGLSLGDIIKLDTNRDFEIIKKSLNITIRIWTANLEPLIKSQMISKALNLCDNAEMHSEILHAFSVCENRSSALLDFLNQQVKQTEIIYEISNG
jgi:hypothetical protein